MKRIRTTTVVWLGGLGGLLLVGGLTLLVPQLVIERSISKLSATDRDFVARAAQDGLQEVILGHLAGQCAGQDALRELAVRILRDLSHANSELISLALRNGFVPPSHLPRRQRVELERLARRSPQEFDRDFVRMMVSKHKQAITRFQQEAMSGTDPELRAFAQRALPALHPHLREALALS